MKMEEAKTALRNILWFPATGIIKEALDGNNIGQVMNMTSLIDSPFRSCGLGIRHTTKIKASDNEWTVKLVTLIDMMGKGIVASLIGKRGTGKTQMAAYAMRYVIERDPERARESVHYCNLCNIMRRIKGTFGSDGGPSEDSSNHASK